MGRTLRASGALVLLVLAACSGSPSVRVDPAGQDAFGQPQYFEGVETEYSVPLAKLGDVDLLGGESVMRNALVAGDEELLVAATAFTLDGVMTLDLVLLNKSDASFDLSRADLHVFDATGRLVRPIEDHDDGIAWGLRGRGHRAASDEGAFAATDEVFGPTWDIDARQLGLVTPDAQPRTKRSVEDEAARREDANILRRVEDARPIPTEEWRFETSPTSVRVRPDDGKVFWAYFDGEEPEFPLTAMVLIDQEQYLFRFER